MNGDTMAMNGALTNGASAKGAIACDVAVVGGGPAGIAAATRAAESGARVFVIDQGLAPGGQIWRHIDREHLPPLAQRWIERCERSGARWLSSATVVDRSADAHVSDRIGDAAEHELAVVQHDHSFVVRARSIVLATGARERFLPYPGWTLPNVMGVGGAQALLKGGADMRGRRVAIAGSGPLVLPVAAAMARAGATLVAVAEQAPFSRVAGFGAGLWSHPSKLGDAMRYRTHFLGTSYRIGTWVTRATGEGRVEHVTLTNGRRRWREACDLLCCSYGLVPNVELPRLLGCTVEHGVVVVDRLQRTSIANVLCVGEPTGVGGELAALVEGEIAGLAAIGHDAEANAPSLQRARDEWRRFSARLERAFEPRDELRALAEDDTIICRCEDVRRHRLDPSWTVRQAKLYTRIGMGPCQGAVCGPACQFLFGWEAGTVRPPFGAPTVGAWTEAETEHEVR